MRSTESQAVALANLETNVDDKQPRYSRRETLLTMLGVLMVMLLASLDQMKVAS